MPRQGVQDGLARALERVGAADRFMTVTDTDWRLRTRTSLRSRGWVLRDANGRPVFIDGSTVQVGVAVHVEGVNAAARKAEKPATGPYLYGCLLDSRQMLVRFAGLPDRCGVAGVIDAFPELGYLAMEEVPVRRWDP